MWLESDNDHPPPSSTKAETGWTYIPSPPVPSWHEQESFIVPWTHSKHLEVHRNKRHHLNNDAVKRYQLWYLSSLACFQCDKIDVTWKKVLSHSVILQGEKNTPWTPSGTGIKCMVHPEKVKNLNPWQHSACSLWYIHTMPGISSAQCPPYVVSDLIWRVKSPNTNTTLHLSCSNALGDLELKPLLCH
jgi:hypothetical protein